VFSHKLAIGFFEIWDPIEDVTPHVKIIALVDDPTILMEDQLGAPIHRSIGIFIESHGHDPIKKNGIGFFGNGENFHLYPFTALGKALT
jgi:hypothetical protein